MSSLKGRDILMLKVVPQHFTFEPGFFFFFVECLALQRSLFNNKVHRRGEQRRAKGKKKKAKASCRRERDTHTAANNRKVIFAQSSPRCSGPSSVKDVQNGPLKKKKMRLFRVRKHIGRAAKCRLSAYGGISCRQLRGGEVEMHR